MAWDEATGVRIPLIIHLPHSLIERRMEYERKRSEERMEVIEGGPSTQGSPRPVARGPVRAAWRQFQPTGIARGSSLPTRTLN